jgi:hypothetical protein
MQLLNKRNMKMLLGPQIEVIPGLTIPDDGFSNASYLYASWVAKMLAAAAAAQSFSS